MRNQSFFLFTVLVLRISAFAETIPLNLPRPTHGLRFDTPVTVWDEALPLGNGVMGALVWGDGRPVKISLDRADLWDTRPVPEFESEDYDFETMCRWHDEGRTADLERLYDRPYHNPAPTKIPAGRIELTLADGKFQKCGLDLADAEASMELGGASLAALVHAAEPVGMVKIKTPRPVGVNLVVPAFGGKEKTDDAPAISAGELAHLGYPAPEVTSGENWRAYHQQGAEGFHFAVFVAWKQTGEDFELAWSVASSKEGDDPLALARTRVEKALEAGYDAMKASHRRWWDAYWALSTVRLPNPILERQWFLEQYKFGSASRAGSTPITLQAVWTADDGKLPPWKGDFHHDLNTQLSYWPCYSGNRLESGRVYVDWLWDTKEASKAWTRRFFKMPGLNVPMSADIEGKQIGGWRQYTHSGTTAAWLAHHFYLHWKYSADNEFLQERAYPYLREVAVFLEAFTSKKNSEGERTFPLSSSPEIHDNRPEAWFHTPTNYDLALAHWLFETAAKLADLLGKTEDARHWRQVRKELPELSLDENGALLVAQGHPLKESHRHFSHLMAIHPLAMIHPSDGPEAQRIIDATLADLDRLGTKAWCGYSFSWLGNLAAYARDGEKAAEALEIFATAFCLRNSFHCNGDQTDKGYSNFRYRPFTLEGNFAFAAGIQEMLLQSRRGVIEVFPAIPDGWQDVAFTTLRAEGGFLVSAARKKGKTARIEVFGESGGECTVRCLAPEKTWSLKLSPGEKVVLVP